jgi:hypothetical protein
MTESSVSDRTRYRLPVAYHIAAVANCPIRRQVGPGERAAAVVGAPLQGAHGGGRGGQGEAQTRVPGGPYCRRSAEAGGVLRRPAGL